MKKPFKYYLHDFRDFLDYMFNPLSLLKQLWSLLKWYKTWYYIFPIIFLLVIIFLQSEEKYLIGGIIILIWVVIALIPIYRSGEHRAWKRKEINIPNKYEIQRLKKEAKNGQTDIRQDERLSERGNQDG